MRPAANSVRMLGKWGWMLESFLTRRNGLKLRVGEGNEWIVIMLFEINSIEGFFHFAHAWSPALAERLVFPLIL